MKNSYLTAGIKLDRLFRILARNKISFNATTIFRLAFLIQSALWSSFFSWIENARYSKALKRFTIPDDPVFIVGHWRTGTTFLHQLMNLDPGLSAPTLFQVAVPDSFLVSYRWYRPIFKRVVSAHRPMDDVKLGMDEPQEDEYAFFRLTSFSPLEKLVFPDSASYFLNHGCAFLPAGEGLEDWKKRVQDFYKKLYFSGKKRIVSKNPFNSFRMLTLLELFPNARFIYLVRHPYNVVPSTMHMWNILQKQNCMNSRSQVPQISEVTTILKHLHDTVESQRKKLPPGTFVQVRFEDLEASPAEVLQGIYKEIGLPFSAGLEDRIHEFMRRNGAFRKNKFSLTADEKYCIAGEMELPVKYCGYERDN